MKSKASLITGFALVCAEICIGSFPSHAAADLGACGDIDVRAEAMCEVVPPSLKCEQMCTPVTIRATCSARLAARCEADCPQLPSVSCTGSCSAACEADCKVDPGKFDCNLECKGSCDGHCEAGCQSSSDKSACMASCQGSCSTSCRNKCDVQLPKADCKAGCQASCSGSCEADANLQCQVDCQAKGYVSCESEVTGSCKVSCQRKEGALFCDGSYVDDGNKLQECVAALKATLNAHVQASSSGTSSCDAGSCMASGKASVNTNCSVVRAGARGSQAFAWAVLAGALACLRSRRRR
jgi:hypothetical protein